MEIFDNKNVKSTVTDMPKIGTRHTASILSSGMHRCGLSSTAASFTAPLRLGLLFGIRVSLM
jgi:hypothetical protein